MKIVLMSSALALMIAPAALADQIIVVAPDTTSANYVSIGEYKGGTINTLTMTPTTPRVVTGAVAPAITEADAYFSHQGNVEASVSAGLINDPIYQPPVGADGVFPAAEMGFGDEEYATERLAAYDTNRDGIVTSSEAIANLNPLIDPNVNAFRADFKTVK